jgi:hypothetical protein
MPKSAHPGRRKQFPDLADIDAAFAQAGGVFLVAEHNRCLVGMAGFRPNAAGQAEVLRAVRIPRCAAQGLAGC